MSVSQLRAFYERTLSQTKEDVIMVSLHVKAPMRKARARARAEKGLQFTRHSHACDGS
jgi:hypothetical protein